MVFCSWTMLFYQQMVVVLTSVSPPHPCHNTCNYFILWRKGAGEVYHLTSQHTCKCTCHWVLTYQVSSVPGTFDCIATSASNRHNIGKPCTLRQFQKFLRFLSSWAFASWYFVPFVSSCLFLSLLLSFISFVVSSSTSPLSTPASSS